MRGLATPPNCPKYMLTVPHPALLHTPPLPPKKQIGALNYFALAHQADFDVRWARGPIGELIFQPLVQLLQTLGVSILPGRRVQEIQPAAAQHADSQQQRVKTHLGRPLAGRVVARAAGSKGGAAGAPVEVFDADAVVFAAGVPALQQLTLRSPLLGAAPDLAAAQGLNCSAVLAARLWVDQKVRLPTSSNVVCGFDAGVGGTLFQLDALQVCVGVFFGRADTLGGAGCCGCSFCCGPVMSPRPCCNGATLTCGR